jgi:hypothetical protein
VGVVQAGYGLRPHPAFGQSGQNKRRQDGNDRNYYHQLNQSETYQLGFFAECEHFFNNPPIS